MKKIPVGILGATGVIGQHYLQLLQFHPWFEVAFLAGSREGPYEELVQGKWHLSHPIPKGLHVSSIDAIEKAKKNCSFVFSALPSEQALHYEVLYASADIPVVSNASSHRKSPDVPLLIPEVNAEHLNVINIQRKRRGWKKGFIITKPNCSIQSFMIPLAPLHKTFKVKHLFITTMQAISGAGHNGLASHAIQDNVIPYIQGEEEKSEQEPLKIWGCIDSEKEGIHPNHEIAITAHCNRVPVLDGHVACVSVSFEKIPSLEDILLSWKTFTRLPLPSSPEFPVLYHDEPERPQSRLDRHAGKGMSVNVGRLRKCGLLNYRFVGLSHNAIRGGAGGGLLNAELLYTEGYLS